MKKIVLFSLIVFFMFSFVYSVEKNIPCRISGKESSILFMTLGNVKTSVAEGKYYPERDLVVLKDGKKNENYYKNNLGVKYFKPIDKSVFKEPPSGWCSWYFYYQEINANEILKNAKWMAENLKEYGAKYVQIDDGWQGTGHGLGENRDWFTINSRFLNPGMDGIAKEIKQLGLKPGLWLAPHGESNYEIVKKNKKAFFLDSNGKSLSSTWEGTYLVKPNKYGKRYLKNLFRILRKWGYEYFKIDGQPIVVREYKRLLKSDKKGEEKYRETLMAIREAIGENSYLLGCWGIPIEGAGIMNGSRTAGDVWLGWSGFMEAFDATMKWYFLHNILWYADPDVILVRPPMKFEIAQAWATLQGLTGQALMESDMMYELPEGRVNLLKKIYPAVNIKPMDLFPIKTPKNIWDLKVSHLGRDYDIVAIFNLSEKRDGEFIVFNELGLNPDKNYHVFDFWNHEYLGSWKGGYYVDVVPHGVRVITIVEEKNTPVLVSTSRHITQGWTDLKSIEYGKDYIKGKSYVIKGDNYTLSFANPHGVCYKLKDVKTRVKYKLINHGTWSELKLLPERSGEYEWAFDFEKTNCYSYPVRKPYKIYDIKPVSLNEFVLKWYPHYYLTAGYNIYLNGKLIGYTPLGEAKIKLDELSKIHKIEIKSVWYDGRESEKPFVYKLNPSELFGKKVYLSDLKPFYSTSGWNYSKIDRSIDGNTLKVGGKKFEKGIGTHAPSIIKYHLGGIFNNLKVKVGIDDETKGKGSVIFKIYGDDKLLWESGLVKAGVLKKADVEIKGVKVLTLEVSDSGDGKDYDHADWLELLVIR